MSLSRLNPRRYAVRSSVPSRSAVCRHCKRLHDRKRRHERVFSVLKTGAQQSQREFGIRRRKYFIGLLDHVHHRIRRRRLCAALRFRCRLRRHGVRRHTARHLRLRIFRGCPARSRSDVGHVRRFVPRAAYSKQHRRTEQHDRHAKTRGTHRPMSFFLFFLILIEAPEYLRLEFAVAFSHKNRLPSSESIPRSALFARVTRLSTCFRLFFITRAASVYDISSRYTSLTASR